MEQITELRENAGIDRQQLIGRQRRALTERAKLLEAQYAGALPLDLLKSEQERLARELGYLEERLSALELTSDARHEEPQAHSIMSPTFTLPTSRLTTA